MRQEMSGGYDADVTIVGEPTDLRLGVAHKGVAWIQIVFPGRRRTGACRRKDTMRSMTRGVFCHI